MRVLLGSRALVVLVCLALLSACTGWHTRNAPPAQAVSEGNPRTVRITRTDGSTLVLRDPQVTGDSIAGVSVRTDSRVAVALTDVDEVQTREVSALRTGGAALAVGLVTVSALTVAAFLALLGGWQ